MKKELVKISKFLSLILRHKPEAFDIKLDKNGWADVSDILKALKTDAATLNKNTVKQLMIL